MTIQVPQLVFVSMLCSLLVWEILRYQILDSFGWQPRLKALVFPLKSYKKTVYQGASRWPQLSPLRS